MYEGLSVPEAHNPINPALNTLGVQCGDSVLISMRVEDTPQHNYQQSSVPSARRIRVSVPTPHGTSLRVGLIGLSAFSTFSDTNNLKHYEGLHVPEAHNPINPALNSVGVQCGENCAHLHACRRYATT